MLSVYLHIPFCSHRCAYCDFNTYAGQEDSIPAYVDALCKEIDYVGRVAASDSERRIETNIHTIFFGGGTPSLLSAPQLASIMDALRAAFVFSPGLEATMEANPGTTSPEFLREIRAAGINRLSFGVQSANPEELHMLERIHDFFDVIQSVKWARQAGFDNLNLDLIYGLPEQTLPSWKSTLQRVVDLHPEHVSAYALTLEHGTPFGRWSTRGLLPMPNPDLAADMYEWADEFLSANGYVQYEISNWAKPNRACRHNLQYWRNLPYLGLGAGAHGYANGIRYSNVLRIKTYIERMTEHRIPNPESQTPNLDYPLTPATVNHRKLSRREEMQETMLTGLRLVHEGISNAEFQSRFGIGITEAFPKELNELFQLDLLEWTNEKTSEASLPPEVLRLTRRARFVSNRVFVRFVD